jgi:hypothetical protein
LTERWQGFYFRIAMAIGTSNSVIIYNHYMNIMMMIIIVLSFRAHHHHHHTPFLVYFIILHAYICSSLEFGFWFDGEELFRVPLNRLMCCVVYLLHWPLAPLLLLSYEVSHNLHFIDTYICNNNNIILLGLIYSNKSASFYFLRLSVILYISQTETFFFPSKSKDQPA